MLDSVGNHVIHNKKFGPNDQKMIFPMNTAEDVVMDENANDLQFYIPTVVPANNTSNTGSGTPLFVSSTGTVSVSDALAAILVG